MCSLGSVNCLEKCSNALPYQLEFNGALDAGGFSCSPRHLNLGPRYETKGLKLLAEFLYRKPRITD
jgi:hypothetical protein